MGCRTINLAQVCWAHHGLSQSLLDQRDAALVDGLAVGEEAALQRRGYRRQTLKQREEILVLILQLIPFRYQWRHQLLDVLLQSQDFFVCDSFVLGQQVEVDTVLQISADVRFLGSPAG